MTCREVHPNQSRCMPVPCQATASIPSTRIKVRQYSLTSSHFERWCGSAPHSRLWHCVPQHLAQPVAIQVVIDPLAQAFSPKDAKFAGYDCFQLYIAVSRAQVEERRGGGAEGARHSRWCWLRERLPVWEALYASRGAFTVSVKRKSLKS